MDRILELSSLHYVLTSAILWGYALNYVSCPRKEAMVGIRRSRLEYLLRLAQYWLGLPTPLQRHKSCGQVWRLHIAVLNTAHL
jgi:hypothetical protein